jgi:hypothetical protein
MTTDALDRSPITLAASPVWDGEEGLFRFRAFGNPGILEVGVTREGGLAIVNAQASSVEACQRVLAERRELIEGRANSYIRDGRMPNEIGLFFLGKHDLGEDSEEEDDGDDNLI